MARAIVIDSRDNVATLLTDAIKGETIELYGAARGRLSAKEDIPKGHKVALAFIPKGGHVIKYGEVIGVAASDISAGEHVHTHNLDSIRGKAAWPQA
mgnify:CR=1 FL=1